ncbi:hypothetical protein ES703_48048 [subsurface metagenome]
MVILNHEGMPFEESIGAVLHLRLGDGYHIPVIVVKGVFSPERNACYFSVIGHILVVLVKPVRVFVMPIRFQGGRDQDDHVVPDRFDQRILIHG